MATDIRIETTTTITIGQQTLTLTLQELRLLRDHIDRELVRADTPPLHFPPGVRVAEFE